MLLLLSLSLSFPSQFSSAQAAPPTDKKLTPLERLDPGRLEAAHNAAVRFANERRPVFDFGVFAADYRAALHVHAEDSTHTKGTREEVLAAAKKANTRIILLSDHQGPKPNTWNGLRDGVLFLAGAEEADKGLLRLPASPADPEGELRFLSHPEERPNVALNGFVGMEICNRHTDAKLDRTLEQYLQSISADDAGSSRFLELFRKYPDEIFAAGTDYRPELFAIWDKAIAKRHFTGIAANDAHQNQVFKGVTLDPYELSFRNLSTHILANELTESEVRRALREGHVYVAHDWLCDATGFAFAAQNNMGVFPMGDAALMWGTTRLIAFTPLTAQFRLIHQGNVIYQTNGTNLTFTAKKPGAYRVEAWLSVAGEERPWIYSNPVYLQEPSLTSIPLPSYDEHAPVDVKKEVTYVAGTEEAEHKHQLDLYLPRGGQPSPVFIFFHGGAWKNGDRSQYPALGFRLAKEGVVTVIPSYRLAPKYKHPAQVEDGAAAFSWVMQHIGEYGGDTNRIYLGGHSAGGHMAALLALEPQFLARYQLSPTNIRGVVTMSGVFDLTVADNVAASVFSTNDVARKLASPLFHIRPGIQAPPFLITYCQWDYVPLAGQAREFRRALKAAGVPTELHYTPHENHISEVIALTHEEDATAKVLLGFLKGDFTTR